LATRINNQATDSESNGEVSSEHSTAAVIAGRLKSINKRDVSKMRKNREQQKKERVIQLQQSLPTGKTKQRQRRN
jgi:hypothetical protein